MSFKEDFGTIEESVSEVQHICTAASVQRRRLAEDELAEIFEFANTANEAYDHFRFGIVRFLRLRSMARRAYKDQGEDSTFNDTLSSNSGL